MPLSPDTFWVCGAQRKQMDRCARMLCKCMLKGDWAHRVSAVLTWLFWAGRCILQTNDLVGFSYLNNTPTHDTSNIEWYSDTFSHMGTPETRSPPDVYHYFFLTPPCPFWALEVGYTEYV